MGLQDISVLFDGDVEIRTYSLVLMLSSPVFKNMLTQEMEEKSSGTIRLPGKEPEEFKVLLEFLHPVTGRLQKVSSENVDCLVRWCDEYCIDSLKHECIEFIKLQPASVRAIVQADCLGLKDHVDSWIDELLTAKHRDWTECYSYPSILQRVLERTLDTYAESLPQKHVHRKRRLDGNQRLCCQKCLRESSGKNRFVCKLCKRQKESRKHQAPPPVPSEAPPFAEVAALAARLRGRVGRPSMLVV